MTIKLTIGNPNSNQTFQATLNKEEWKEYSQAFEAEEERLVVYPWTCLLIPTRVNSFVGVSKDLFLPTTVNLALKINNLIAKTLMVIGCALLDAITFPVRLLTGIPWKIMTPKKEDNNLFKFLLQKNVPEEILKADYVKVKVEFENIDPIGIGLGENRYNRRPLIYLPLTALMHPKREIDTI